MMGIEVQSWNFMLRVSLCVGVGFVIVIMVLISVVVQVKGQFCEGVLDVGQVVGIKSGYLFLVLS